MLRPLRAGDGVHFTMKGYRMMWDRAIAASGEADSAPAQPDTNVAVAASAQRKVAAAAPPVPMPEPTFHRGGLSYGQAFPIPLPAFHRPLV